MNWRDLPPLSALRAFAAFAQAGNVVAAGDALGVSHAAISQQLRSLETHLDIALLDRSGRALRLTPDGIELAQALDSGFSGIIETVRALTGASDDRPLHISTTPSFAASWLMPRLAKFRQMHPQAVIMLDPTAEIATLGPGKIDLAIRHGAGNWPGLQSEVLFTSPMVVVAAPSLVGEGPTPDLAALARLPWLEEMCRAEADSWLGQQGVLGVKRVVTLVPGNLLLDGARDGQGVIATLRTFVAADIESGRLRELIREDAPYMGYHIVTRPGSMRPVLKSFLSFLRREVRE